MKIVLIGVCTFFHSNMCVCEYPIVDKMSMKTSGVCRICFFLFSFLDNVCIYKYVCICVCMYMFISMNIRPCIYIPVHIYIYKCMGALSLFTYIYI